MKIKLLLLLLSAFAGVANAQDTSAEEAARRAAAEAQRQAQIAREQQAQGHQRLKAISENKLVRDGTLVTDGRGRLVGFSPTITEMDRLAITVDEVIQKKYKDLLEQGKAGLVRLQNANLCTPNRLIVAAVGGCPNNVTAKATAFLFRTGDYRPTFLSDIFYEGTALSSTGAYTFGIFASLGQADIKSLGRESDGVRQLLDFIPPADGAEFDRQSSILRQGVRIGNFDYLPQAAVTAGEVYVLRSIAYRAKLFKGEKPRQVDVLAGDERADITVLFKVESILSDGSVVLFWRELKKSPPPRVVLEADLPKPKIK